MPAERLAVLLRRARARRGLTRGDVAAKAGLPLERVAEIENGSQPTPAEITAILIHLLPRGGDSKVSPNV